MIHQNLEKIVMWTSEYYTEKFKKIRQFCFWGVRILIGLRITIMYGG